MVMNGHFGMMKMIRMMTMSVRKIYATMTMMRHGRVGGKAIVTNQIPTIQIIKRIGIA